MGEIVGPAYPAKPIGRMTKAELRMLIEWYDFSYVIEHETRVQDAVFDRLVGAWKKRFGEDEFFNSIGLWSQDRADAYRAGQKKVI